MKSTHDIQPGGMLYWPDLAFKSSKSLPTCDVFMAAPREMSQQRCAQLLKQLLPKGNLIWGIADEDFIDGFDNQPQYKTLRSDVLKPLVAKVEAQLGPERFRLLRYNQRDVIHVVKKLRPKFTVFVRGSWQFTFHTQPLMYELLRGGRSYEFVSPFCDEAEAMRYAESTKTDAPQAPDATQVLTPEQCMRLAERTARSSYDHSFQVGAVIAAKSNEGYVYRTHIHNRVVPYETFALHHGFAREDNFAAPNDQNFYDTIHAETSALLRLKPQPAESYALFVNVMPCPGCTRTIVGSGLISEVYYGLDHSNGYAQRFFTKSGIRTERILL